MMSAASVRVVLLGAMVSCGSEALAQLDRCPTPRPQVLYKQPKNAKFGPVTLVANPGAMLFFDGRWIPIRQWVASDDDKRSLNPIARSNEERMRLAESPEPLPPTTDVERRIEANLLLPLGRHCIEIIPMWGKRRPELILTAPRRLVIREAPELVPEVDGTKRTLRQLDDYYTYQACEECKEHDEERRKVLRALDGARFKIEVR